MGRLSRCSHHHNLKITYIPNKWPQSHQSTGTSGANLFSPFRHLRHGLSLSIIVCMSSARPVVAHLCVSVCTYCTACMQKNKAGINTHWQPLVTTRHLHLAAQGPPLAGICLRKDCSRFRDFPVSRRELLPVFYFKFLRGATRIQVAVPRRRCLRVGPQVPQAVGRLHDNFPSSQVIEARRE